MPLNKRGESILDPTPTSLPVSFKRPDPLSVRVAEMLASQDFHDAARRNDMDTPEEAEDFEIEDDYVDPQSPWEENFDPVNKFIGARIREEDAGFRPKPRLTDKHFQAIAEVNRIRDEKKRNKPSLKNQLGEAVEKLKNVLEAFKHDAEK